MNPKEMRWRQRFENFHKAYGQFQEAIVAYDQLNLLEKEGLIQRFKYALELAWKTLKDYLEAKEVIANFPRDVIEEACRCELIGDGDTWTEMLESRRTLIYTFNEERLNLALYQIKGDYYKALSQVHQRLQNDFERK
ncbi:nucleotidyltransferase [Heliobacillus mobilis]|uniref:Nucleotidyltransferase n=1 Tax=Heliobacterium mobile TaxID=28064 RepID=A0A6I3SNA8_HELMO|nr:HI0074 family nucleotidyltransferase substrate-binding subunit [Heliobacterium mobile]MTV50511.1 nucleotidyltransferase [Heliobacterium mobile]